MPSHQHLQKEEKKKRNNLIGQRIDSDPYEVHENSERTALEETQRQLQKSKLLRPN